MEHFLSDTADHDSSFFQPTAAHDDDEDDDDGGDLLPHSSPVDVASASAMETSTSISPVKNDTKAQEPTVNSERPRARLNRDEEANIKLQVLVSNFSDEQLDRYETYRRSAFSKVSIKRMMHSITGSVPSSNVVIAIAGIAKVFVGEIVEEALDIQRQELNGEQKTTPLEPKHLREAYRRMQTNHPGPPTRTWKSKRASRF